MAVRYAGSLGIGNWGGGGEAGRRFKAEVGELLRWLMREDMMMTVVAGTRLCYFLRPVSSAVRDILRWRPPM